MNLFSTLGDLVVATPLSRGAAYPNDNALCPLPLPGEDKRKDGGGGDSHHRHPEDDEVLRQTAARSAAAPKRTNLAVIPTTTDFFKTAATESRTVRHQH